MYNAESQAIEHVKVLVVPILVWNKQLVDGIVPLSSQ